MFKKTVVLVALLVASCGEKSPQSSVLPDPAGVSATLVDKSTVRLVWDAVPDAVKYEMFLRGESDPYYVKSHDAVGGDVREYTFIDLPAGKSFYFGVMALGKTVEEVSRIVYSGLVTIPAEEKPEPPEQPEDPADKPVFTVVSTCATSAYIGVRYKIGNAASTIPHGICYSESADPTTADAVIAGPSMGEKPDMLQLIPASSLAYGRTYHVRTWATVASGTYYGPDTPLALAAEPAALQLTWTPVSAPDLPAAIKVYETSSPLNGRAFHAWYAVADCTGDVEFRVQYPSATATVETQFGDDCWVLINGSVFGGSGKSIGMAVTNGSRSTWRAEADGQYWGAGKLMQVTRATFGVDAAGKPATCWSGYPDASHLWYYERPLTSVAGEASFSACTAAHPAPALDWTPRNAIAGGPMLLHDGICPTDRTETPSSPATVNGNSEKLYMSNYDLWANDIFGDCPDRTAVGYTADGKVVLFVCDGRITASKGAYVDEVARILRGIGCIGAVNLDGGLSTAMMVRGRGRINDATGGSRKVCTTLGFFKR